MFHIIERREIAHRVFLEGWQHYADHSIRYYRNDREGPRSLPGSIAPDSIIRLPVGLSTLNEEMALDIASYNGRFIPAAMVERKGEVAACPPGVAQGDWVPKPAPWEWTAWLHTERQPTTSAMTGSRRQAIEEADVCLGKYLGLDIHDDPPIPWDLTDRIYDLEAALTPILKSIQRGKSWGVNLSDDEKDRIVRAMQARQPFAELKASIEYPKAG